MWLRVLTGPDAGLLAEIKGPRFVVGSAPGCDLVLRGQGVAPHHAAFEERPDGAVVLVDLDSERGTFVATRRVAGAVRIGGEEELCFGDVFAELVARPVRTPERSHRSALVATGVVIVVVAAVAFGIYTQTGGSDRPSADGDARPAATDLVEEELPFAGAGQSGASGPERTPPQAPTSDATSPGSTDPVPLAPEEPPASSGEAGPVETLGRVFRDDFSDPASGWEVFDDEGAAAAYRNDQFVITVKRSDYYATAESGRAFETPAVRVTAMNPSGSTGSAVGIVCRYQDQDNFDLLAVGTNGTAAILRSDGGDLSVLTGSGRWSRSAAVPVGARRYRLRAECGTDRLSLAVDDRRVLAVPASGPPGTIGLFVVGTGEIRFDDFAATEPRTS